MDVICTHIASMQRPFSGIAMLHYHCVDNRTLIQRQNYLIVRHKVAGLVFQFRIRRMHVHDQVASSREGRLAAMFRKSST